MFQNLKNMETMNRTTILVYGKSKVGKTSLVKTLPADKTLVVDLESGLLPLKGLDLNVFNCQVNKDGDPLERISRFKKFKTLLSLLQTEEKMSRFEWVVIDSVTELAQLLFEALQHSLPKKEQSFTLWALYADHLANLIKNIRDNPKFNFLLLAWEKEERDDIGRPSYGPDFGGGKVSNRVPHWVDEVLRFVVGKDSESNEKRVLVTKSGSDFIAGDRSGRLDPIEEPHLENIKNKILGETNE